MTVMSPSEFASYYNRALSMSWGVTTPRDPGGTSNTMWTCAGLGVLVVPVLTGRVRVSVTGSISNSQSASGASAVLIHGAGDPPGNGVLVPSSGSVATNKITVMNPASTFTITAPFALEALVTGLPVNTPHWLDIASRVEGLGVASVADITFTIQEW